MKRILTALMASLYIAIFITAGAFAQQTTYSTSTWILGASVSTTTQAGWLITNTIPSAKISRLEISWIPNSSTATLSFYDKLFGTTAASTRCVDTVLIPSSTITGTNSITKSYEFACPWRALYGLQVVQSAGTKAAGEINVKAVWW